MRRMSLRIVAAGTMAIAALAAPAFAVDIKGYAHPKVGADYVEVAKARVEVAAKVTKLPSPVQPSLQALVSSTGYRLIGYAAGLSCSPYDKASQVVNPDPCWLGDPTATRTLVLYGDSHAGSWIPAMDTFAKSIKAKLAVFWFPGCPTPLVVASTSGTFYSSRAADCNRWNAKVTGVISSLNAFAVVMASGYGVSRAFTASEYQQWLNGWTLLANQIRARSPRTALYLLSTTPYLRQSAPECLLHQSNAIQNCGYTSAPSTQTGYGLNLGDNKIRDIASAKAAGATLVDVSPLFCVNQFCPAVIGSTVVYGDAHHITTQINLDLAPALGQLLNLAGLR